MTAPAAPLVPHGATALRPEWTDLPDSLRTHIEERLGSPVSAVANQGSGFTPGFASRLAYGRGESAFVKAASSANSPVIADCYQAEARIVPRLPDGVPTPRVRWTSEHEGWVVLCFDDVPGQPPARPWGATELARVLTALTPMAEALTPGPPDLVVPALGDWLADDFGYWRQVASTGPDAPDPQIAELATLEDQALDALSGDSVVHCDLRDDNVIMGDDGQVWICDWNWPSRGAAWLDLLTLLISARGDGYDGDALFSAHPLGANVDPEAVDAALAGLSGYFTRSSVEPDVPGSPHLRTHQAWYAQACLSWLAVRRKWVG